ncbi:hypothetical protein [uncultured Cohaesibacter sp.]|uniref:hypothetical protein n=1 Tax=uncultured Cohaesibacter sp. TaxID=1002546 RepID=UPI003747B67E
MPSTDINISGPDKAQSLGAKSSQASSHGKGEDRKARLSQALRDNLKRRKAQTRARKAELNDQAAEQEGKRNEPDKEA